MKKESVQEGFSSTSKKDSNEERENRTIKQNRNLNIKIDLERGKPAGNLGSEKECCLAEKNLRKEDENSNMFCGLAGKECICCEWKRGMRSSVLLTT